MKTRFAPFATGLLIYGVNAFADVNSESALEQRIDFLERKIDSLTEQNAFGCCQPIHLSSSIENGLFVEATFLYWNAAMENIEFFEKHNVTDIPKGPLFLDITYEDFNFEYKPGFELGLGYIFPNDQWDLSLSWTHLYSKIKKSAQTPESEILGSEFLKPNWLPLLIGGIADKASGRHILRYNTLDLMLGRNFFLSRKISARPFAGIRAASIQQNYKTKFHSAFVFVDKTVILPLQIPIFANTAFSAQSRYRGLGFRAGLDLEWHLSCHWSILSNLSGSLLSGWFRCNEQIDGGRLKSFDGINVQFSPEFIDFSEKRGRIRPSFDAQLGIQWQHFFCQGRYQLKMSASYYAAYWEDQNELIDFIVSHEAFLLTPKFQTDDVLLNNARRAGSLEIQGLNLEASFEF